MTGKKKLATPSKPAAARRAAPRGKGSATAQEAPVAAASDARLADAVNAVLHPAQPVTAARKPRAQTAPAPKLKAKPQPAEPERPVAEPASPVAEPASPVAEPERPAAEPKPQPAELERPVAEPERPAAEPAMASSTSEVAAAPADPHAKGVDGAPASPPLPVPDFDALSRNMSQLVEESGKLAATLYGNEPPPRPPADIADAVQTLGQVAEHWFADPARLMEAQTRLTAGFFDLWAQSANRMATGDKAPPPPPPPQRGGDKRFSDPSWRDNPVYDFMHKAFLLGSQWANGLVDKADGLDEPTKEKARFYMRQVTSALSPSNFVPTNPELLRLTLQENGGNLLRGLKMLSEDLAAGKGQLRIRHTDTSQFQVGVNMATTPGKVVFRNDLMELLQYAPSTPQVLKRPLLIVPPWINKFYVLDLNPEKSFIRWAVAQGLTVFVISWVNPDERHATMDFEAYMRLGLLAALDAVKEACGEEEVSAIGYCVGGTLLAVTLAHMAARGDMRISSATLFTAQVDFTHAGDLKVFADETQIRALESQMSQKGYLRGAQMAQAFNMLRPEDLIWSYWVNNYLRGKEPPAFDLLAWNSDSTRMPAANHSFYLRNCYLENNLARGLMEIAGERLDLKRVTVPIYNLATREDHIAPALSVFEGCKSFGGPVRYVLSGSGHVAGVVNPPNKVKYGYTDGPAPEGTLESWLAAATEHPGSWWPDWFEWTRAQTPALVPAREPGGGHPTLGDAPGENVRVRA